MNEYLELTFVQNSLLVAILASIASALVGSYVVIRKMGYVAGGIAHAAFGGVGLGYFLGINPSLTLIPFSLISALGIGMLSIRKNVNEDTIISLLWTAGMAFGIILIGLTPGYMPDLFGYLFGNILTVSDSDLYYIVWLDLFIVILVILFYREFLAISFDEEYATLSGINTTMIYILMLSMISVTIVILAKVVGIIMVIAMLTIPPSIAMQWAGRLRSIMLLAFIFSSAFTLSGLALSYKFDIASGATIVLVSTGSFLFSTVLRNLLENRRLKN